jgi:hypothetical protein
MRLTLHEEACARQLPVYSAVVDVRLQEADNDVVYTDAHLRCVCGNLAAVATHRAHVMYTSHTR